MIGQLRTPISQAMARCIYCTGRLLPRGSTDNHRSRMSLEHIIPLALGGLDELATEDCCSGCNNDLGATVDSSLLHDVLVVMERQRFLLVGHSGKVPELRIDGRSVQTGTEVTMTVRPDLDVRWLSRPKVAETRTPEGNRSINVSGTPEDVLRILTGIKHKAEAKGERIFSPDGGQIDDLDQSVRVAAEQAQVTTEYLLQTTHDLVAVRNGLAKIAFGFAHLALGPGWTFEAESEPLRKMAKGVASREELAAVASPPTASLREMLLRSEKESETRHLIALLPTGTKAVLLVSLFGSAPLSLAFPLTMSQAQFVKATKAMRPAMVSPLPGRDDVQWELSLPMLERLVAGAAP